MPSSRCRYYGSIVEREGTIGTPVAASCSRGEMARMGGMGGGKRDLRQTSQRSSGKIKRRRSPSLLPSDSLPLPRLDPPAVLSD